MSEKATQNKIVEAADRLFYQKGYDYTSFSDIADAVQISRGNVTFHFSTKDEILAAVIDLRLDRVRSMLEQWETSGEAGQDRIKCFINILVTNRAKIMRYGCPLGTLCNELAKLNHDAQPHANKTFVILRDWLSRQFSSLGHGSRSDGLAMHVLAWSQGIATLANAFHDENFIRREVQHLHDWLDALTTDDSSIQGPPSAHKLKSPGRAPRRRS